MYHHYYRLEGHTPVPCSSLLEMSRSYANDDRCVAKTEKEGVVVSTVFLGINHAWGDGPPLLFETMIFGGPHNEYQERCSTWEEAEEMHRVACALAYGSMV